MKLTALIVDDERLARIELRHLLGQTPLENQIEVIGEAKDADEALDFITSHHPDLVFLDIQMPGKNGFEMLEELTTCPFIVFTTAYDEYALKAFAANALDYLLKPIDQGRLQQTIEKVNELRTVQATTNMAAQMRSSDKVFIKDGEKCFFIAVQDVIAFVSIGNYCRVILADHEPMIRKTLGQLEARLPDGQFFRASRAHIINLAKIQNVDLAMSGNLEVSLTKGMKVELSRRQSQVFKETMGF